MSSKRTHFVTDREMPRLSSTEVTFVRAVCGDRVKEPVRLHAWDNLPIGTKLDLSAISGIGNCKECLMGLGKLEGRVTLYAVRSADSYRGEQWISQID